ncbi:hypothetical protein BLA29_010536, partial [Euroglyphus maynei]
MARKPSDASSSTVSSSLMSQSLRCKSSYALQQYSPLMVNINDSPKQTNHHHHQQPQRRIAAKRISTLHQPNPISNMMMNYNNHQTSSSSSFFQSADSEFTFVNSKATTFKPENSITVHTGTNTVHNNHNNNNSPININYGMRSNRISSSASLMLNNSR